MNNNYHTGANQFAPNHTHELLGNTFINDNHNHRIAAIDSKAIAVPGGHIHEVVSNTSYDDGHIHQISVRSGLQIPIANNRHIHLVTGTTTVSDGHSHNFQIASLLE